MYEIIANYMKKIRFKVRWLIMSDRERYSYLWKRTRDNLQVS